MLDCVRVTICVIKNVLRDLHNYYITDNLNFLKELNITCHKSFVKISSFFCPKFFTKLILWWVCKLFLHNKTISFNIQSAIFYFFSNLRLEYSATKLHFQLILNLSDAKFDKIQICVILTKIFKWLFKTNIFFVIQKPNTKPNHEIGKTTKLSFSLLKSGSSWS